MHAEWEPAEREQACTPVFDQGVGLGGSNATIQGSWLGKLMKEISEIFVYKDGDRPVHCSGWQACKRGMGTWHILPKREEGKKTRSLARLVAEEAHEQHASDRCMPTPVACSSAGQLLAAADPLEPAWPPCCMQHHHAHHAHSSPCECLATSCSASFSYRLDTPSTMLENVD